MRSITLDLETTGLDPYQGHKIIEIGCVELYNNFPTGKVWQKYVNPKRNIPLEAYEIHGISDEFLIDKPFFSDIADELLAFIEESTLIIHNANFDLKFLNYEMEQINKKDLRGFKVIDTLALAKKLFPGMPANLDSLSRRYKVDLTKRKKHGALLDAEILADVYLEMQGGRQQGMQLKVKAKEESSNEIDLLPDDYSKKVYQLKEQEIKLHKEMLLRIKKSALEIKKF